MDIIGRRRNRDRRQSAPDSRLGQQGPVSWLPAPLLAEDPSHSQERADIEAVLEGGHYGLRFPPALESAFQASVARHRRVLLSTCAVIGLIGFWLGSANDVRLMNDVVPMAVWLRTLVGVLVSLSVLLMLAPFKGKKNWHYEALTAANTLLIICATVTLARSSRALTVFTHSACLLQIIMYAGVAAQQRFRYTLISALVAFVAYVTLVHGHDHLQSMVVAQNIRLFVLGMSFTLVANYLFEYRERRAYLLRRLADIQQDKLAAVTERLQRMTLCDPLTGINNRRQFDRDLDAAWSQSIFSRQTVCLLMIDVDFFKQYNDSYGHPVGDLCLQKVAEVLQQLSSQVSASVARIGGEEFALLLPHRSVERACAVGAQVCAAVHALQLPHPASEAASCVTVSVGVGAMVADRGAASHALLKAADHALYRAKQSGRNRCIVADQAATDGTQPPDQDVDARAVHEPPAPEGVLAQVQALPAPHEATPDELAQAMGAGLSRLRFARKLEVAYANQGSMGNGWRVFWTAVLGMIIVDIYLLFSQTMFADVAGEVKRVMWALNVLAVGAAAVCIYPMEARMREWIFSIGISTVAVALTVALSRSQQITTLSFMVALLFVPVFGALAARQSFWHVCVSSFLTVGSILIFMHASSPTAELILMDSRFMVINATIYALIVAYVLDRGGRMDWLLSQLRRRRTDQLRAASMQLHKLSMVDPLTRIYNRRQFDIDFARVWSEATRSLDAVALMIIDVDHFKAYNDGYGHPAGDLCLQQIASVVHKVAKQARGMAVRLGGEEFSILLPGYSAEQAARVAEGLCAAVRRTQLTHGHSPTASYVTVSVGVAARVAAVEVPRATLLAEADDALYQAKATGRNRVAVSDAARAGPLVAPADACASG